VIVRADHAGESVEQSVTMHALEGAARAVEAAPAATRIVRLARSLHAHDEYHVADLAEPPSKRLVEARSVGGDGEEQVGPCRGNLAELARALGRVEGLARADHVNGERAARGGLVDDPRDGGRGRWPSLARPGAVATSAIEVTLRVGTELELREERRLPAHPRPGPAQQIVAQHAEQRDSRERLANERRSRGSLRPQVRFEPPDDVPMRSDRGIGPSTTPGALRVVGTVA
jgi:hypothetical protein